MKKVNKIILLIDIALLEIDKYVAKSIVYSLDREPISDFRKVLRLLKAELEKNPNHINERVLRATRDIGGIIIKQFEETPLEDPLYNVFNLLSEEIYYYKKLEPLRMDFGKGDPI